MPRFEPQPDVYGCDDPMHDECCSCGADPDHAYESKLDI